MIRRSLWAGALCMCAATAQAHAEEIVVKVEGGPPFKFEQPNVTIKPGDTVKWVNKSGVLHTITADDAGALTGTDDLQGEGTTSAHAEVVKGGARTIGYHCAIHPKMKGTITVAEATPAVSPTPAAKPRKKPRKRSTGGYGGY